jgi:hypothetical protein
MKMKKREHRRVASSSLSSVPMPNSIVERLWRSLQETVRSGSRNKRVYVSQPYILRSIETLHVVVKSETNQLGYVELTTFKDPVSLTVLDYEVRFIPIREYQSLARRDATRREWVQ